MRVDTSDDDDSLDNTNTQLAGEPLTSTQAPDAIDRGVSFLKLIANSSLGTAQVRDQRMAGRKAIMEIERVRLGATTSTLSDEEQDLDLEVATELELRGYTFEAELRYRAALRPDRPARPLTDLAQLIEAKGRYLQALPLYAYAAQAGESNALFRLATISYQIGEFHWSRDFAQLGSAALDLEQVSATVEMLRNLSYKRRTADLGAVLTSSAAREGSIDAIYALGSMLLTSGRDDLARLALSTAVARGHTLAGITLIDLIGRRQRSLDDARLLLSRIWHDDFRGHAWRQRRDRPGVLALGALSAAVGTAVRAPWDLILAELAASLHRSDRPDEQAPIEERIGQPKGFEFDDHGGAIAGADPLQTLLVVSRTVTILRGLVQLGFDSTSLGLIDDASGRLCSTIANKVLNGKIPDISSIVREIWRLGAYELAESKQRRLSGPPTVFGGRERVPAAGGAYRFGRTLARLDDPNRQVLLLAVAGVPRHVIAESMGLDSASDVDLLLHAAVDRLHAEQQGEQYAAELWQEVEACFSAMPQQLKTAFDWFCLNSAGGQRDRSTSRGLEPFEQ